MQEISFAVSRGETIAFVGPSGSGKTTLVKLLVGLYRPLSGHIYYNGTREDEIEIDGLRERIGFVTQDAQLFSGSIRENLLFVMPEATDAECMEVLRQASADTLLARADRGLDTVIGEGGVKVSGGEKQRLSIARALLRKPQLLVFDEATSSLDSLTEEEISQTIRDVAASRDAITILIAHRLSTVLHADRIYVLERGRIVESGRHEELTERRGLYYAMWRQQVEKTTQDRVYCPGFYLRMVSSDARCSRAMRSTVPSRAACSSAARVLSCMARRSAGSSALLTACAISVTLPISSKDCSPHQTCLGGLRGLRGLAAELSYTSFTSIRVPLGRRAGDLIVVAVLPVEVPVLDPQQGLHGAVRQSRGRLHLLAQIVGVAAHRERCRRPPAASRNPEW